MRRAALAAEPRWLRGLPRPRRRRLLARPRATPALVGLLPDVVALEGELLLALGLHLHGLATAADAHPWLHGT
eukprot:15431257-Alexandrium_andersonii.AAC.1